MSLFTTTKNSISSLLFFGLSMAFLASCSNGEGTASDTKSAEIEYDESLLAMVLDGNEYGYINPKGEYVIKPEYPLARSFSNGVACVNSGGQRSSFGVVGGSYKFIDTEGNVAIDGLRISQPMSFYDGRAKVDLGNGNFGFIDTKGDVVIQDFTYVDEFREGLARAIDRSGQAGYIDVNGQMVLKIDDPSFVNNYGYFADGRALVRRIDPETNKMVNGFMNTKGEEVIPVKYEQVYHFKNGYSSVLMNDKWGFVDTTGNLVIPCEIEDCGDFSDGLVAILEGDKWGFMDTKGAWVIKPKYEVVDAFSQGYAPVLENGKVGFINKKGEWLVKPKYQSAQPFKNGFAIVQLNGKLGFIDLNGDEVGEIKYTRVGNFVVPDESNPVIRIN